jgi:hypothetical protein
MCSLAAQRRGSSRLLSRDALSRNRNSSRGTSIAAETPEGRGRKVRTHRLLGRVLSNGALGRVVNNGALGRVASSAKSAKFSASVFDMSQEGWPAGHPFVCRGLSGRQITYCRSGGKPLNPTDE